MAAISKHHLVITLSQSGSEELIHRFVNLTNNHDVADVSAFRYFDRLIDLDQLELQERNATGLVAIDTDGQVTQFVCGIF